MPSITITDEQARQLAAGESITLEPPKPTVPYNCAFYPLAVTKTMRHSNDDMAPADEPIEAARSFYDTDLRGRDKGAGLIIVCPKSAVDGQEYRLATNKSSLFRVDSRGKITPGI